MAASSKLAAEIAALLNIDVEEVKKELPTSKANRLESDEELLHEAQSVVNYFEWLGKNFYREVCKQCKQRFRYSYYYKGIKLCSIQCAARYLESLGLRWTPHKPLDERWGFRGAPMVIAPQPLRLIDKLLAVGIQDPLPFDSPDETSLQPEKVNNHVGYHHEEHDQFLESLDQLLERLDAHDT